MAGEGGLSLSTSPSRFDTAVCWDHNSASINLLSAPLAIPLGCCHIKSFRRASSCGEAMARRRKEARRAGLASRGMCSDGVVAPPVCGHRGVPACGVVPDRCTASGSAVDAGRDAAAWARRAERAADGGVVPVEYALQVSPRAPPMHAQRVAPIVPLSYPHLLVAKAMTAGPPGGL